VKRFLNFVLAGLIASLFILMNINVKANSQYTEKTHELRGVWVATVSQLDMPQQSGTTPVAIEKYKQEFIKILDTLEEYKMNAIIFQVRPLNDAFYRSEINPWSRYLAGVEGLDPGWDPLAWMIEESHKRGIEFHAWLNPYRASLNLPKNIEAVENYLNGLDNKNFAKKNRDLIVLAEPNSGANYQILLNPGEPRVRQHIIDTIEEIITNYDVDAIHFDDYFYNDVPQSQDDTTRTKPGYNPKNLSKADWRRDQVNILIKGIHDLITAYNTLNNKNVQFGISPAPMWAPSPQVCVQNGHDGGLYDTKYGLQFPCWGYYTYVDLYADTRKWVLEEWIDYIVPQNYFELERYHRPITEWWSELVKNTKVKLYMGIGAHNQGANTAWDKDQMRKQLTFNNQFPEVEGIVLFSYKNIARPSKQEMIEGTKTLKEFWTKNTMLPHQYNRPISGYTAPKPTVKRTQNLIELTINPDDIAIGYNVYKFTTDEPMILTEDKVYDRYRNFNLPINIEVDVNNDDVYIFVVEAFLPNGTKSSQTSNVIVPAYENTHKPLIEYFEISRVTDLYRFQEKVIIRGKFSDPNGDRLTATLELYLKDRYRGIRIDVIDNQFEVEFYMYSLEGDNAAFRLTVTDGAHTVEKFSHRFSIKKVNLTITSINYIIYQQRQKLDDILK